VKGSEKEEWRPTSTLLVQVGSLTSTYPMAIRAMGQTYHLYLLHCPYGPQNLTADLHYSKAPIMIGIEWNRMEWDGMGRDGMGWDGMGWDGMGWDGMGWDGMGWDGMGWDGMGWDAQIYPLCWNVASGTVKLG